LHIEQGVGRIRVLVEPVLVHDPIRLLAMGRPAFVEDEGLAHADPLAAGIDDFVAASGLPEASGRGTVGPRAGGVLLVLVAEEVPVILWCRSNPALLCMYIFERPRIRERLQKDSISATDKEVTLNVPRFKLIEIDIADDVEIDLLAGDLLAQVVVQELLLSGMEAKARGHARLAIHSDAHLLPLLLSL